MHEDPPPNLFLQAGNFWTTCFRYSG